MSSISPLLEERSTLGPIGIRRIQIMSLRNPRLAHAHTHGPVLDKLSSAYDSYRSELLLNLEDMVKSAMHSPEVVSTISRLRGGGSFSLSPEEMHVLYALPLAYFSSAYWDGVGCGQLTDRQFLTQFVQRNPSIAKYLSRMVAKGGFSSIL